jgi:hypothetical protein
LILKNCNRIWVILAIADTLKAHCHPFSLSGRGEFSRFAVPFLH